MKECPPKETNQMPDRCLLLVIKRRLHKARKPPAGGDEDMRDEMFIPGNETKHHTHQSHDMLSWLPQTERGLHRENRHRSQKPTAQPHCSLCLHFFFFCLLPSKPAFLFLSSSPLCLLPFSSSFPSRAFSSFFFFLLLLCRSSSLFPSSLFFLLLPCSEEASAYAC